jgi:hypothetical protein
MGERAITAMHGYHPSELQSYAALMTNQAKLVRGATAIPHMYDLMKSEAEQAFSLNQSSPGLGVMPNQLSTVPA